MNTFERVRNIVAERLDKDRTKITPQTSLVDDLGPDSLDRVEIAMAIEEEFCIEFGDETMALTTIQQMVDYIEVKIREQVGA